jgi:hypothetical protein
LCGVKGLGVEAIHQVSRDIFFFFVNVIAATSSSTFQNKNPEIFSSALDDQHERRLGSGIVAE